jgi:hypothetical protein
MKDIEAMKMCLVLLFVAAACCWAFYRQGYDQGRNDGFHAGWRECQNVKEETK